MPAIHESVKYHDITLKVGKLRKLYNERTGTISRRRGHAPSRWNRTQLIAALQQDDSVRFDFFSDRLPPEIRNLIYDKMKEVYEEPIGYHPDWRPTKYPDLKNMRLTCRQANSEVSGILYSDAVFKMPICWQLGPGTHSGTWKKESSHSNIKDNGDQAEEMLIPQSPILAFRQNPELSGLRYIVACEIRIDVAVVTNHPVYQNGDLRPYLNERVERNFQKILSKIIVDAKGLSKNMKLLKISWTRGSMNYDPDLLFRMVDLVLRALSAVPGKVHLDTEHRWGPLAVRWELSG